MLSATALGNGGFTRLCLEPPLLPLISFCTQNAHKYQGRLSRTSSFSFTMARLSFCFCFLVFLLKPISCLGDSLDANKHAAMFIFGDSLYDTGNSNYFNTTPNFQGNYYPYGETFFHYPTGRTTNGRVIPDFIAEHAGIPYILPYLYPGNKDLSYGSNFGSGGAGCLPETLPGLVLSLHVQVNNFLKAANQLRSERGNKQAKQVISNAVYLFAIGSNDYVTPYIRNSTFLHSFSRERYVQMVVGNYTDKIREIYARGGRKFSFLNFGDLGCLPMARAINNGSCIEDLTTFTRLHNAGFSISIKKLERELKGFKYSLLDYYTALNERINNPSKYGFEEGRSACCGTGPYRGINSCGGRKAVKEYELCPDPSKYIFFDAGHLTEAIYHQLADLMWSGAPDVVGPYNLHALFSV